MGKKVHLVLGSGGARGMAHIGVIELLLEQGYEILDVVGCSMGAVVGGMYCSGQLPAYRNWLLTQTRSDIYSLFDLAFSRGGLMKGERIFEVLRQLTGAQRIEQLHTPFTAVATELLTRTEVHFRAGDLYKALRASTAIPGVFTPVTEGEHLFVDGGVLNPLPIDLVRRQKGALVVAVNLNGAVIPVPVEAVPVDTPPAPSAGAELLEKIHRYFAGSDDSPPAVGEVVVQAPPGFSMFELLDTSYDATLDRLVELTVKIHPPDVLIEIPRNVCSVFEFHRASEIIEIGRAAYRKALDGIGPSAATPPGAPI